MVREEFKFFKYELALGTPIPMPKPKIDVFPNDQNTVQQFLHAACKVNAGSLGKKDGKWAFSSDVGGDVKLSTRPDITQIFDFAQELGVIEPMPTSDSSGDSTFTPFQLSKSYWDKFDKFAS